MATKKKKTTKAKARAPAKTKKPRASKPHKDGRDTTLVPREVIESVARHGERVDALAKVFAALGARHPEKWATAHVEHGADELGRFVLLRALWLRTVEPGRLLAQARKEFLVGEAIDRLLQSANLADLDALIRHAQRSALYDIARVLDDPADNDEGIRWAVFRVDAAGIPLWQLDGLRAGLDDSEPR